MKIQKYKKSPLVTVFLKRNKKEKIESANTLPLHRRGTGLKGGMTPLVVYPGLKSIMG